MKASGIPFLGRPENVFHSKQRPRVRAQFGLDPWKIFMEVSAYLHFTEEVTESPTRSKKLLKGSSVTVTLIVLSVYFNVPLNECAAL